MGAGRGLGRHQALGGAHLRLLAGGLIGNFTGESEFIEQRECLAGNPRVYGQLVGLLGKYSKFASAGEKAQVRAAESLVPPETTPGTHLTDAPDDRSDDR